MSQYRRLQSEKRREERIIRLVHMKETLISMGFSNYKDYLNSDFWKEIRKKVLERDTFLCQGCGRKAIIAHHRDYSDEVLRGENITPIVSVCILCHKRIEFRLDGGKRTDYAAEIICRNLIKRYKNRGNEESFRKKKLKKRKRRWARKAALKKKAKEARKLRKQVSK